jgi:hypothetical protein
MHYDYVNKCVHSTTSVSSLHDMTGSSLQWVKECIVIVHIFNGEMEIYWTTESEGEVEGVFVQPSQTCGLFNQKNNNAAVSLCLLQYCIMFA